MCCHKGGKHQILNSSIFILLVFTMFAYTWMHLSCVCIVKIGVHFDGAVRHQRFVAFVPLNPLNSHLKKKKNNNKKPAHQRRCMVAGICV